MEPDDEVGSVSGCACGLDGLTEDEIACEGSCFDEAFSSVVRFMDVDSKTQELIRKGEVADELADAARDREAFCRCVGEYSCGEPTLERERIENLKEAVAVFDQATEPQAEPDPTPGDLNAPCPHPARDGKHEVYGDGDPENDQCRACGAMHIHPARPVGENGVIVIPVAWMHEFIRDNAEDTCPWCDAFPDDEGRCEEGCPWDCLTAAVLDAKAGRVSR